MIETFEISHTLSYRTIETEFNLSPVRFMPIVQIQISGFDTTFTENQQNTTRLTSSNHVIVSRSVSHTAEKDPSQEFQPFIQLQKSGFIQLQRSGIIAHPYHPLVIVYASTILVVHHENRRHVVQFVFPR